MKKRFHHLIIVVLMTLFFGSMLSVSAAADDSRTGYRNYDHSYDEVIAEALRNHVNEYMDDKFGPDMTMSNFGLRIGYVLFTHTDIMDVRDVSTFYRLATGTPTSYRVDFVEDLEGYQAKLKQVRAEVDALISEDASELEIVHILHDYLVSTSTYNTPAGKGEVSDYSVFYASGVYNNRSAVCRGISHAYKYLLDLYGIDSAIVESTATNHVWNLVHLDNDWYHIDLTFDEISGYDNLGYVGHEYFLLSTKTLLEKDPNRSDFEVCYKDLSYDFNDATCGLDQQYESGQPWNDCYSACHYYNGDIYTIKSDSAVYKNGEFFYQPNEYMGWHPNGNTGARYTNAIVTAKLTAIGKDLYINSPRSIYHVDLDTGVGELAYAPEETKLVYDEFLGCAYNPNQIFGMSRLAGGLYIAIESDLPTEAETWTYVPGFDVTYDDYEDPEPEVPSGLIDPQTSSLKDSVSLTSDMAKTLTVKFAGLKTGETLRVSSDNEETAKATISETTITVKTFIDGVASIRVEKVAGGNVQKVYTILVTVNKNYKNVKNLTLTAGDKTTVTDETGDYSGSVNRALLDEAIATVNVTGLNKPGTPAVAGGFTALTTFAAGQYVIGYESGSTKYYLKASGSTLSAVTSRDSATQFTFAGSATSFTIKSGTYYLTHGSKLALSTSSSNSEWCFDGGKIYYTKKSFSRTYKYYLRYSSKNFTVANSTSTLASAYSYTEGTPEIPGEVYTKVEVTAISAGKTYVIVGDTLYKITVERLVGTQEITVHTVDDAGVTLAADYTISGKEGETFYVQPTYRYGYLAPDTIVGTYTEAEGREITLVYTLNTDKSALKNALENVVAATEYTNNSYLNYQNALNAGTTVYNKARATQTEVDNAVTAINNAKNALAKKTFTVTVNFVDNFGTKVADAQTLTGEYGSSYTVSPKTISGYISPSAVSGKFYENETITLTYTLNTDKSALANALNNVTAQGEYTDDSYAAYTNALASGRTVYENERATQAQADAAVKAINDAKAALKVVSKVSFVKDTDGINSGSEYVIAYNGKALAIVNGALTYITVTETDGGIGAVDDSAVWILTKYSSSSYYIVNKATGQYLTTATSGSIFSRTYTLSLTTSKTTWTATKNGNYMRFAKSSRYVTYSNGFGLTTSKTSNTDMTLYVKK